MRQPLYIISLSILIFFETHAQESSLKPQGFYELSQHEVASGLIMLPEKQFFLYSIFGSVDLKLSGQYELNGNSLSFSPDSSALTAFRVYGSTEGSNSDSIQLYYHRPRDWDWEMLALLTQDDEVQLFPEFASDNPVLISIKRPKDQQITLMYSDPENNGMDAFITIPLRKETAQLRIIHNYYAAIAKEFVARQYSYQDSSLIVGNQRVIKQKVLSKDEIEKATSLIEQEKNKCNTMTYRGQVFERLNSY